MAKFNVSGLSIKDVASLDKNTIDQLAESKQLSKVVSRLVSAMNKRIRYLSKSDVGRLSPTYLAYEKRKSKNKGRDGFYSVKGKDTQQLKDLYRQLSRSLTHTTTLESGEEVEVTTARGWKKHRQEILNMIGYDFKDDQDREKKFWTLYHKFQEQDKSYKQYRRAISDRVLTFIANEIGSDFTDSEENIKKIQEKVDKLYEEITGEESDQETETGTSQFFADGGNV